MTSFGLILIFLLGLLLIGGIVAVVIVLATRGKNEPADANGSYFDGNTIQHIGWSLLCGLITAFSFGIAYPWAECLKMRWEVKHTVINGRRLKFTGYGIQIFGWNILWSFLTVITFGIFSIWRGLYIQKWKTKHTVFADEADSPDRLESRFTGGAGGWFLNHLLLYLLSLFTFGIALPWAEKNLLKWKTEHTVIGGSPLVFYGTGGQLFVKYLLLALLTPFTLGIYNLFFPVIYLKWRFKNTKALYRTEPLMRLAREHEETANKDYAKFRLAANEAELAAVKSGINGNESIEQLEEFALKGNPFACYRLAVALKGENPRFEDRSLELLKLGAGGKYYEAMFDFAPYAENESEYLYLLEESARAGAVRSPWFLKNYYEAKANAQNGKTLDERLESLKKSAYWFKVAIELEDANAVAARKDYEAMLDRIALWLCSYHNNASGGTSVALIVIAAVLGVLLLGGAAVTAMMVLNVRFNDAVEWNEPLTRIPVVLGDSEYCQVLPNELYRYESSEYGVADETQEQAITFSGPIYEENVEIITFMSSRAYYDYENELLYLDFGVSEKSHVGSSKDLSVYLVSPDINGENNKSKPLTATLRPGESISKIPCKITGSPNRLKVHVIVYNQLVNSSEFVLESGNLSGTVVGGNYNVVIESYIPEDAWIGRIGSRDMPLYIMTEDEIMDAIGEGGDENNNENNNDNIETPSIDVSENELVGMRTSVSREGDYLTTSWYDFHSDGTFETGGSELMHTSKAPELFPGSEDGWETVPMGFPYTYGTYKVEDGEIILTIMGDSIEFGEGMEPYESVLYIRAFGGDIAKFGFFINTIDGEQEIVNEYLKDFEYDNIEELCDELGVDTTP